MKNCFEFDLQITIKHHGDPRKVFVVSLYARFHSSLEITEVNNARTASLDWLMHVKSRWKFIKSRRHLSAIANAMTQRLAPVFGRVITAEKC